MPILLRLVVIVAVAYIAGSVITPMVWAPVLAQQSREILSPFAVLSAAIFIFAVVWAVKEWRKK